MAKVKLKNIKINISFTKADSKITFILFIFIFCAKKRCQYYVLLYGVKEKPLYTCIVYQEESTILHKNIPWVKLHQYSQKYLYPKLNGYGDNRDVSVKDWELLGVY